MEKYVLVKRNQLPVAKETESVSDFVRYLIKNNLGCFSCFSDATDFEAPSAPPEGHIAYLAYGQSTREMVGGEIVPNRAVHQFGGRVVAGVIWNDEFAIVRRLPDGYAGLTDEEIKIAKKTFGKWSISYAHTLGFRP